MRYTIVAAMIALSTGAAFAQTSNPVSVKDIGTTSMPPGRYYIVEESTKQYYALLVTDKGNMILAPPPQGIVVRVRDLQGPNGAQPAAAATTAAAPAVTATAPVAAPAATPATAQAAPANASGATSAMKDLFQTGMQKGMEQLVKQGAVKHLGDMFK